MTQAVVKVLVNIPDPSSLALTIQAAETERLKVSMRRLGADRKTSCHATEPEGRSVLASTTGMCEMPRSKMKEMIMKIVVIGGSGLIGSKLVTKLREHGHEAIAASPNSGVDTLTGEGLAEAMRWCRMRPMARYCASRDARFTPVSSKCLKANLVRSRRASPSCWPIIAPRRA